MGNLARRESASGRSEPGVIQITHAGEEKVRMGVSKMARLPRFFIVLGACFALLAWSSPELVAMPRLQPGLHAIQQNASYRARLYAGDCETIDLSNAIAAGDATIESGSDESSWSWSFAMTIDGPIGDVTAAPHAISVEVAEGDLVTTVACGELAGEIVGARLVTPLTAPE